MHVVLKSRIPQIQAAIPVAVGAAVRSSTEAIAERAALAAPDRVPEWQGLPASIRAGSGEFEYGARSRFADVAGSLGMATPRSGQMVGEVAYGVWAAWYWHFQEFGTSKHRARPFMLPAVDAEEERFKQNLAAAMRRL